MSGEMTSVLNDESSLAACTSKVRISEKHAQLLLLLPDREKS